MFQQALAYYELANKTQSQSNTDISYRITDTETSIRQQQCFKKYPRIFFNEYLSNIFLSVKVKAALIFIIKKESSMFKHYSSLFCIIKDGL